MSRILVLVIEGLGTNLVGPYGSSLARTPILDHMAATGIVLDQCFVDSTQFEEQLHSLWTGQHNAQIATEEETAWSLWRTLTENRVEFSFWTDCPRAAEKAENLGCSDVVLVAPSSGDDTEEAKPAESIEACQAMALFSTVSEFLVSAEAEAKQLIWIHSRGLKLPWDAPQELRNQFTDPDDPEPPNEVGPPSFAVDESADPDLIVGWGQVATAQAHVLDEGVANVLASLKSRADSEDWSWLLSSLGGVPLGEHGWLGWHANESASFYAEELQTTTILFDAEGPDDEVGQRYHPIAQLPDLSASILDIVLDGPEAQAPLPKLWGRSLRPQGDSAVCLFPAEWPSFRQLALIRDATRDVTWIRCPAWSAVLKTGGEDSEDQLFVKPEDRWEINNVAMLRRDVLEDLTELSQQFVEAARKRERDTIEPLAESLTQLLR